MDALSLIAAAYAVGKVAYQASTGLYTFVQDARNVDQSLKSFITEIESLERAIDAIRVSLQSPSLLTFEEAARDDNTGELWKSVHAILIQCHKTLEELHQVLQDVRGRTDEQNLFRQAFTQFKLNMNADNIVGIRSKVHTHHAAMGLALQTINVYIGSKGPDIVIGKLNPKLDVLIDMVAQFDPYQEGNASGLVNDQNDTNILHSTKQLREVAKKVASSASSVISSGSTGWGGSQIHRHENDRDGLNSRQGIRTTRSAISSVQGDPLSIERLAQISTWNLETFVEEEDGTLEGITPHTTHFHDSGVGSDGRSNTIDFGSQVDKTHADGSDSEGDIAFEIFNVMINEGQRNYDEGKFEEAERFFRRGVREADTLPSGKVGGLDGNEVKLKLALACYKQEKLDEAKTILLALTSAYSASIPDAVANKAIQASHVLAEVYLKLNELDQAEQSCKRAMLARRRTLGKEHPFYYDSVRLLALIYQAKGDLELAVGYSALLPVEQATQNTSPKLEKSEQSSESRKPNGGESKTPEARPIAKPYREKPNPLDARPKPPDIRGDEVLEESKLRSRGLQTLSLMGKYDVNLKTFNTKKALFWAARVGSYSAVWVLLTGFPRTRTPGELARNSEIISVVVKNVDTRDNRGNTALILAAQSRRERVVQLLIEKGADVNTTNFARMTPLMAAADSGNVAAIHMLLKQGAAINAMGNDKRTALVYAIYSKQENSVQALLEYDPDLNLKTSTWKHTALELAARLGLVLAVQALIDKGADLETAASNGDTPLLAAASQGHAEVVTILGRHGANLEAEAFGFTTALKYAARWGHESVARALLDLGANVEGQPSQYRHKTALGKAAKYNHLTTVKLLLERGAKDTKLSDQIPSKSRTMT
ncbi:MAG: hypothetical protein M1840_007685 [Geoglossum simile]|nr:MAG: hypothetical protein M1840_007685 [Geoglossum simile]